MTIKYSICLAIALAAIFQLNAQSKTLEEYIAGATIHFSLDSTLSERGYALFDQVFSEHRFVILGEYHGSSQIGRLTEVLLPIYRKHHGNIFGLEIGTNTAGIINTGLKTQRAMPLLRDINTRYDIKSNKRTYTPIPFFSNLEDALFLQMAKDQGLEIAGLDYEFIYSYPMLLDKLAEILEISNASAQDKSTLKALRDSVNLYQGYDLDHINGDRGKEYRLPILLQESKFVNESLKKLSSVNTEAEQLTKAIKVSNEIYYHHVTGNWWESNEQRTQNFVNNFHSLFIDDGQLSEEKLFLKIGGLHAAKGINNYNKYDIGNLIYETARLTNSQSCHMVMLDRFWNENDETSDILTDTASWYGNNFRQLLEVAEPDKWTVIDLDEIRKQGLYHEEVSDRVREYFARYDLVLIPPVDREPVLNLERE